MSAAVRYEGKWFKIIPKKYEPERQTNQVAWMQIKEPIITPEEAYRRYFENSKKESKVLCPSFRQDD